MARSLVPALCAICLAGWLCGCGTTSSHREWKSGSDRRFSGLAGKTVREGQSRSLYTGGEEAPPTPIPDNLQLDPRAPDASSQVTSHTVMTAKDPVKKRNLLTWDSKRGWYYTILYRQRNQGGAYRIMPEAINIPGTGRRMQITDNHFAHMDRTYSLDVSKSPRQGVPTNRGSSRRGPYRP